MKIHIYLLIFCTIITVNLEAQKGFQIGIGSGYMLLKGDNTALPLLKEELKDYRIQGGAPIFFEVKTDYAFNSHWQLRSGTQWRWRTISIFEGSSDTRTHLSVPLIANYRLPLNTKKDIVLGFNVGIAIDNYLTNSTETNLYYEAYDSKGLLLYKVENTSQSYIYNGNFLSFNGSFRVGIEVEKDYGSRGRIGLQMMYNYQRGNIASTISDIEKTVYKLGFPDRIINERIQFDEKQTGYQLGLFYYFGSFQANQK